jgi:hypothetical protein
MKSAAMLALQKQKVNSYSHSLTPDPIMKGEQLNADMKTKTMSILPVSSPPF